MCTSVYVSRLERRLEKAGKCSFVKTGWQQLSNLVFWKVDSGGSRTELWGKEMALVNYLVNIKKKHSLFQYFYIDLNYSS